MGALDEPATDARPGPIMRRGAEPILITDAQHSPDQELRHRERRYLTMMGLRIACLVLAAALAGAGAPMLWLWLPLCGVGMVLLPWLAVIIANDGPAKNRQHLKRYQKNVEAAPANSLPTQATPRTIDGEL